MDKRQFILDTLLPYFADPTTCAINEAGKCMYLTPDGRKCAVGKHIDPASYKREFENASLYLVLDGAVMVGEAAELSVFEWRKIQPVHDQLAGRDKAQLKKRLELLHEVAGPIPELWDAMNALPADYWLQD